MGRKHFTWLAPFPKLTQLRTRGTPLAVSSPMVGKESCSTTATFTGGTPLPLNPTGFTYTCPSRGSWLEPTLPHLHPNQGAPSSRVAILISDKVELKSKTVSRDNESDCILTKGSIQQIDITV